MTLLWLFFAVFQLLFWGVWVGGAILKINKKKQVLSLLKPQVSVIVCARNEAQNLQKYLPFLANQDYPNYELIIVNDDSTDETAKILADFQQEYPLLIVLSLQKKEEIGKKKALAAGIKLAQGEWVLLTDADCQPSSEQWISTMISAANPHTELVLGYSPYRNEPTWLNRWIQFETTYTAIQYLSAAAWGSPYMGVGRNLMYKKSLYQQSGGFSQHAHLPSGDDDLFVNQVANSKNTEICLDPTAWTLSLPPLSWAALYQQKKRHASVGGQYKFQHQLFLGNSALSYIFFYTGFFLSFFGLINWIIVLYVFIIRQIVFGIAYWHWLKKNNKKKSFAYTFFLDIFVPVYYIFLFFGLRKPKIQRW